MNEMEELQSLRRLAELEDKAAGKTIAVSKKKFSERIGENAPKNLAEAIENSAGAGVIETLGSMVSGTAGQVAGGYAGLAQGAANLAGANGMPAGERAAQVQEAMTYEPRFAAGKQIGQFLSETLGIIPRVADAVGERIAAATGSPAAGAAANTAIQAAPSLLPLGRQPIRAALTKSEIEAAKQTALAGPKTTAIQSAKDAGYVIPPAEANPAFVNRVLEGFSGQPKLQQLASSKNQGVTNSLVRNALGIAEDVPLSIDALTDVRKQAGAQYDNVRNIGNVVTDADYVTSLDAITSKYVGASKSFPKMGKNEIKDAVDAARVAQFDSAAGVDAIKVQRELADKAFRSGDMALGKAHKSIAEAIEEQIDRNLPANPEVIASFRDARRRIAQSYDAQAALKGNDIDARVLAKAFEKGRLTGEMAKAGEFGSFFKGASQTGSRNAYVPSLWETLGMGGVGTLGGLAVGSGGTSLPVIGAIAAGSARPLARSAMLSGPGQAMLVRPQTFAPSRTLQGANALAAQPAIMNMLALTASQQQNGN